MPIGTHTFVNLMGELLELFGHVLQTCKKKLLLYTSKQIYSSVAHPMHMAPVPSAINLFGAGHNVQGTSHAHKNSEQTDDESSYTHDQDLSAQEKKNLNDLKARDREVKAHEHAHLSAASGLAVSGPTFTFVEGPDGKRYAVGGEVQISVSAVAGDPAATIRKAEQIRRAALAPTQPSAQDQKVAASANAMANQARFELLREKETSSQEPALLDLTL